MFLAIRHFKRQFGHPKPISRGGGGGERFAVSPETAITLYFRQFLSQKHAKFHKIFFLAPLGRLLVSQVVLRRGGAVKIAEGKCSAVHWVNKADIEREIEWERARGRERWLPRQPPPHQPPTLQLTRN